MTRAVLDTNVLISACLKPDGLEARVLSEARAGRIQVFVSEILLAEYRDVAARKKFAAQAGCLALAVAWMEAWATRVTPGERVAVSTDDDDNRLLECASAAEAAYLVTGNKRHFPEQHGSTRVVNAREFIDACF